MVLPEGLGFERGMVLRVNTRDLIKGHTLHHVPNRGGYAPWIMR